MFQGELGFGLSSGRHRRVCAPNPDSAVVCSDRLDGKLTNSGIFGKTFILIIDHVENFELLRSPIEQADESGEVRFATSRTKLQMPEG
jgi:hypothetical protein